MSQLEQQTLKLTGVLSDPTRFSIYQYISKRHREVTVQDIAEAFHIHPNVARLHLTKLEDVDLLTSQTKKSGKGGRPSRYYTVSDQVVQIQFPFRDYEQLANMALEALLQFGEEGKQAIHRIGKRFGKEAAERHVYSLKKEQDELSVEDKIELIRTIATEQGLSPEVTLGTNKDKIHFRIYNCPYKEMIEHYGPYLCSMHHAMLEGMFQVIFPEAVLKEETLISSGEFPFCSYTTATI